MDAAVRARRGGFRAVRTPITRGKALLNARRMDGGNAMKIVGRVIRLAWAGLMVAMAATALAALNVRRRIVPKDEPDADEVQLVATFEPILFESTAGSFRGGKVDLWFGGGIIDLRDATLDPAGARLDVRAMFGGCQLLVPESWNVTTRVLGIGGAGDGRPKVDRPLDAPHLTVEGTALFGGVGIASEIPDDSIRSLRDAVAKRQRRSAPMPEPVAS
jgi:hypothetical protein